MRDFVSRDGANLRRFDRGDRDGVAVECSELDLESLAIPIDVHHRADVTDLQAVIRNRFSENNSVVLGDLPQRVTPCRDRP